MINSAFDSTWRGQIATSHHLLSHLENNLVSFTIIMKCDDVEPHQNRKIDSKACIMSDREYLR